MLTVIMNSEPSGKKPDIYVVLEANKNVFLKKRTGSMLSHVLIQSRKSTLIDSN